jgi:sarcosine oxidase/L-pipecolate oxidase
MEGWKGYFNELAGYARAGDALRAVYEVVKGMGVDVRLGEEFLALEHMDGRCTAAVTAEGKRYAAEVTIVALGASVLAEGIVPGLRNQVTAKCWTIAHVQLSEEEAERLKGVPVTHSRDLGFFAGPDGDRLLKLSPSGGGFTNYVDGISVPREEADFLPAGEEEAIREILREHLPSLADRPLVGCKICWCADAVDSDYMIDFVPVMDNLVVATGDSGHAFKMFPLVGEWVKKVIEDGEQKIERWKWKERAETDGEPAEVSWRVGKTRDLSEVM